jgi:hypothetical protein
MELFILLNILSFLRLVVILLVIWYGFKLLMRFIAPKVIDNAANKIYNDMQNRASSKDRRTVRNGDVTIDYSNKKPKQFGRREGDYIEFEEIDDKK